MQQNFLSPIGFRFVIKRLPNVAFFVQSVSIPGISGGPAAVPTPFRDIRFTGDKIRFEPFTVNVRLDENMDSYREMYNWLIASTKGNSYEQFKNLQESEYGIYSDASLVILNSRSNPNIEFQFKDVFPVSLGSLNFDTTQGDVNYISCDMTFEYNGFEVKSI